MGKPYLTLQPEFEAEQSLRVLAKWLKMAILQRIKNHLLFHQVNSLAEEIEYKDVKVHQSMWRSKLSDGKGTYLDDASFRF